MNYIVVSSFKSFDNYFDIKKCLEKQTIKPLAWYIFNDSKIGFVDNSKGIKTIIIKKPVNEDFWYYKRLAFNMNEVFNEIKKSKDWLLADCFMKLDDDTILPKNYVEKLLPYIVKFNYGCVSGKIISKGRDGKLVHESRVNDYAIGTGMLIKQDIITYLGGYPIIPGSDTVVNLASRYLGYLNKQFDEVLLKQTRLTGQASGFDRAYGNAIKQYYLRYPFWIIVMNFFRSYGFNLKAFRLFLRYCNYLRLNVKEKDRLNDFDLVVYNFFRLHKLLWKEFKRKVLKFVRKA